MEGEKQMKHFLTSALGVIGAGIAAAFGGWGAGMTTLCIFMAIDYITGLLLRRFGTGTAA